MRKERASLRTTLAFLTLLSGTQATCTVSQPQTEGSTPPTQPTPVTREDFRNFRLPTIQTFFQLTDEETEELVQRLRARGQPPNPAALEREEIEELSAKIKDVVIDDFWEQHVPNLLRLCKSVDIEQVLPQATGSFAWPVNGLITHRFNPVHPGLDIAAEMGTPIKASDGGTVIGAGTELGYGNYLILHHGQGNITLYAHLSEAVVQPGQTVQQGATIGKMGSTGRSTGSHLHLEIIRKTADGKCLFVNPFRLLPPLSIVQ